MSRVVVGTSVIVDFEPLQHDGTTSARQSDRGSIFRTRTITTMSIGSTTILQYSR
jgi:hypothetical protein